MSRKSGRSRRFQSRSEKIDPGHQAEPPEQQPPVDPGQHDEPAGELDDRPPGVVEHAEDQLADPAGVLAEQARGPARLELVDPVQRQPDRVLEDPAGGRRPAPACVARVARQRPQSPTTSPTVETASTAATSSISRALGVVGDRHPARHRLGQTGGGAGRSRSPASSPPGARAAAGSRPTASPSPARSTRDGPPGSRTAPCRAARANAGAPGPRPAGASSSPPRGARCDTARTEADSRCDGEATTPLALRVLFILGTSTRSGTPGRNTRPEGVPKLTPDPPAREC